MLIDTYLSGSERAAPESAAAQAAGYDGAFTGEVNADPFLPLAIAATATERIDLGTSIAVAFARSPMTLAYTAWDLQRLSRGRFMLGLGSQVKAHITRRYSMAWGRPVAQMREFLLAMQAIWYSWDSGEPLFFDSEHYQHTLMPANFVPASHGFGPPKVLVAGVGDTMTAMAGEVADGFLCHAFTTERWFREHTLPALHTGLVRAGKSPADFTIKASTYLATGTDEQITVALDEIRGQIAFYASTPAYQPLLELHGWGEIGVELIRMSKAGQWARMGALVDDDMVAEFAVVGSIEEVPALLDKRYAGVLDRVAFLVQEPSPELREALRH
ncbi:MAG TPA: TIGR03617 family F420-dependent LLM class oxidoreductase [Mycobacteriales bacterium]|nr:TIGR03617 family F420-dependent LLM class oxidoreductase [Mycobacteriales bacterium]